MNLTRKDQMASSQPQRKQIRCIKKNRNIKEKANENRPNSTIPTEIDQNSFEVGVKYFQTEKEICFLEHQFNDLVLSEQSPQVSRPFQCVDVNQYLSFKYHDYQSIYREEDILNLLKKITSQQKSKKSDKMRNTINFFVEYICSPEEIEEGLKAMFSMRDENQRHSNLKNFKLTEKKSLVKEAFQDLLLD